MHNTLSTPEDCLKWAFDNLHPKLAKASSFGAEDAAIVDMMFKINSNSRYIRYKLSRKESTKSDKQYDYLDWWQKSKKDKEAE